MDKDGFLNLLSPVSNTIFKTKQNPLPQISSPLPTRVSFSKKKNFLTQGFAFCLERGYLGGSLKIISGLQNFYRDNVAAVVTATDKGGATCVDIACDTELVKMAISLTAHPICVSYVDPAAFPAAVEAGASLVRCSAFTDCS